MRNNVRKCDSCIYNSSDYRGYFCGCPKSTEYKIYSVYGWCEEYTPENRSYIDSGVKKNSIYINDMAITLDHSISLKELERLFSNAMKGIGVIEHDGIIR